MEKQKRLRNGLGTKGVKYLQPQLKGEYYGE